MLTLAMYLILMCAKSHEKTNIHYSVPVLSVALNISQRQLATLIFWQMQLKEE